MRQLSKSPEYRIVIPGKAVSFRSPKAKDYKNLIRDAAQRIRLQAAEAYSLTSAIYIAQGVVDLIKPLAQHEEYLFIRVRDVLSGF